MHVTIISEVVKMSQDEDASIDSGQMMVIFERSKLLQLLPKLRIKQFKMKTLKLMVN